MATGAVEPQRWFAFQKLLNDSNQSMLIAL